MNPLPPAELLDAVRDRPADNLPRLAYADWLESRAGGEDCRRCNGRKNWHDALTGFGKCFDCQGVGRLLNRYAERAEFIRAQCATHPIWCSETRTMSSAMPSHRCPACGAVSLDTGYGHWSPGGIGVTPCCEGFTPQPIARAELFPYQRSRALWLQFACGWFLFAGWTCMSAGEWEYTITWHSHRERIEAGAITWNSPGERIDAGVQRGFVTAVRTTLRTWEAHAAGIVAAHPIQWVWLTDREPSEAHDGWVWRRSHPDHSTDDRLPAAIFNRLREPVGDGWHWKRFDARNLALAALSAALIAEARREAGLPLRAGIDPF